MADDQPERGSALMLLPATVLVLLLLAALALDHSVRLMAQRRLENEVAAAANDLATLALSESALYEADEIRLDPDKADAHLARRIRELGRENALQDVNVAARVIDNRVVISASARGPRLILPSIGFQSRITAVAEFAARAG